VLTISAQLPIITDEYTHLTGYTQPGAALGDNASRTIQVEIRGAANSIDALRCTFDHFELSGIAFHGFRKVIYSSFVSGTDIHIWGNYLGLQSDGTAGITGGNGFGIQLNQSAGAFIGTNGDGINDANEGNIISNTRMGVFAENSSNLLIAGNWIGIEADGVTAAPNTIHGIEIDLATGPNIIGFDDTAVQTNGSFFRNVISGNTTNGIRVDQSDDVRISGNYIGTNASGTVAVGNNVGVYLIAGSSNCIIGTDSDGNSDVEERNIISGNGTGSNPGGVEIEYTGSNLNNRISGNYIGVDVTGNAALPNQLYGVYSARFNDGTIVGTNGDGVRDVVERNIISGNNGIGVSIEEHDNSIVAGNYVGVGADGVTPLGNNGDGIRVRGTGTENIGVGCSSTFTNTNLAEIGNIVRNNSGAGIYVTTGVLYNNCLRNNLLGNNGELGIDLRAKGVEHNDIGDVDSGPNGNYNYPIIESSILSGNSLQVRGYSRPGAIIDFYIADAGPTPNPLPAGYITSFGEGVTIIGSATEGSVVDLDSSTGTYTEDGKGGTLPRTTNRFEFVLDVTSLGLTLSDRITAIATEPGVAMNTSEFSGVSVVSQVNISGTIFEDVNYSGGEGRDLTTANSSAIASGWTSGDVGVSGARVELYNATGNYVNATTTNTDGDYSFSNLLAGDYTVRVVSSTVSSNRGSNATGATILPVQTYKSDGTLDIVNEVGGIAPSKVDASANTTSSSLSALSTVSVEPNSVIAVSAGSDIANVDFGFNFNTIVNTNSDGQGSLAQFILNSNELANTNIDLEDNPSGRPVLAKAAGEDVSIFEIPGAGPHTIALASALPDIEDANTHISGYTQQGSVQGNPQARTIVVALDGGTGSFDGLRLDANNLTVSGLALHSFDRAVEMIRPGASTFHVWGNFVGLETDGVTTGTNNNTGVYAQNQTRVIIGTDGDGVNDLNEGNVIADSYEGINLRASANCLIAGNYVGVDRTGTTDAGNRYHGIYLRDCTTKNVVGLDDDLSTLTAEAARNISSGNGTDGIRLSSSSNQIIAGNYLGTDQFGGAAIENGGYGVQYLGSVSNNQLGTDSDGSRDAEELNIISGNGAGVRFIGSSTGTGNIVAGNYIGVNVAGDAAVPNVTHGIVLLGSQPDMIVGTNADGLRDAIERNVISGNRDDGIRIDGTDGARVSGNYIGVGADGVTSIPNEGRGIIIATTTANCIIGHSPLFANGSVSEVGNVIRNNGDSGMSASSWIHHFLW